MLKPSIRGDARPAQRGRAGAAFSEGMDALMSPARPRPTVAGLALLARDGGAPPPPEAEDAREALPATAAGGAGYDGRDPDPVDAILGGRLARDPGHVRALVTATQAMAFDALEVLIPWAVRAKARGADLEGRVDELGAALREAGAAIVTERERASAALAEADAARAALADCEARLRAAEAAAEGERAAAAEFRARLVAFAESPS